MRTHSKIILALVTAVLSLPAAFGQNDAQEISPASAPSQTMPNGPSRHHAMNGQPMNRPDRGMDRSNGWNREGMGWGRDNHAGMGQRRHQFMLARLVSNPEFRERIGITNQQAEKIRTETSEFRIAQIRRHADVQIKRLELKELLRQDTPDRHAIDNKLQELSVVRLAQAKSAVNFHLDMRAMLTPEQKQKLRQMREERFQRRDLDRNGIGGVEPGQGAASQPGQ